MYYDNNCYKFNIGAYFSWSGCQSQCDVLGASMLCISDSTKNTWIANQISQLGYSNSWIGYSDLPKYDLDFIWISGCLSSYMNWFSSSNINKDCAYISSSDSKWYAADDSDYSYISCSCEYSISTGRILKTPSLSPSLSPVQQNNNNQSSRRSSGNLSITVGIVLACVFLIIIFFLILIIIYFIYNRRNQISIPPSNNDDDIDNQAYTADITPTCPPPGYDDENNILSSPSIELQVNEDNAYHKDQVPTFHESENIPISLQV